jgi:hypothetical protein
MVIVVLLIELDLRVERNPVTGRWHGCKAVEQDLIQVWGHLSCICFSFSCYSTCQKLEPCHSSQLSSLNLGCCSFSEEPATPTSGIVKNFIHERAGAMLLVHVNEQNRSWERWSGKLEVAELVRIFPASDGSRLFTIAFTGANQWSLTWVKRTQSAQPNAIF